MNQKQRGMTLISWVLVLAVAFLFGIAALRLVPVYLEYIKVSSSLTSVQKEFNGQTATVADLRRGLEKRFDIESVHVIKTTDVKVDRVGNGYVMRALYDHHAPFVGNVGFIVHFDKSVQIASQ
jgi:hypothetical protein